MTMKFITLIFTFALFLSCNLNGFAYQDNNLLDAINVMEEFIASSEGQGDSYWSGFKIISNEPINDASIVQYGYVFELEKIDTLGYGIIVKNSNNQYIFAEGSFSSQSPYKDYDDSYKNIYTNSLDYYVVKDSTSRTNDVKFLDIQSGNFVSKDELIFDRFDYLPLLKTRAVPGETVTYISQYNTKFIKGTQQPNGVACIPTSLAMSLLYLHNTNQIVLDSGYRTISKMRDAMFNDMYDSNMGMCSATDTVKGLHNFTANHSNKIIETKDNEF